MGSTKAPIAVERRYAPLSGVEVRADGSNVAKFQGHAAVVNQIVEIARLWREKIAPGFAKKTIEEKSNKANGPGIAFLLNHDPNTVMARSGNGSLRLKEDDIGLFTEADLDLADWDAQRLVPKLASENITQMSFAFRVIVDEWDEEPDDGGLPIRTIKEVELFDVSPVTFPAYEGTDGGLAQADRAAVQALLRARPDVCQIVDAKAAAEYLQTSSANEPKGSTPAGAAEEAGAAKSTPLRVAPRYRDLVLEQYRP